MLWPIAADLVRSAVCHDDLADFEALEQQVLDGRALLWLVAKPGEFVHDLQAAVVTQIAGSNGMKYCTVVACAGVRHEVWIDLIKTIEAYAKDEGCAAMRIWGRKGWQRELPDYRSIGYILERAL